MEHQQIQALAEGILRLNFIELEASGRHVHVTKDQAMTLFGHSLTPSRPLSQPGQFLARERVTVIGPKGEFRDVAVLGPERGAGQVEVSLTDTRVLGIAAPIRMSGDVTGTPGAVLVGPQGRVELPEGVIVAQRHIHLRPQDAAAFGVKEGQMVKLQTYTQRPIIFDAVAVRIHENFAPYVHLDYDESNACGFRKGDLGRIRT